MGDVFRPPFVPRLRDFRLRPRFAKAMPGEQGYGGQVSGQRVANRESGKILVREIFTVMTLGLFWCVLDTL